MRRLISCLAGILFFISSTNICKGEELPLWEAGIGSVGLDHP